MSSNSQVRPWTAPELAEEIMQHLGSGRTLQAQETAKRMRDFFVTESIPSPDALAMAAPLLFDTQFTGNFNLQRDFKQLNYGCGRFMNNDDHDKYLRRVLSLADMLIGNGLTESADWLLQLELRALRRRISQELSNFLERHLNSLGFELFALRLMPSTNATPLRRRRY